LTVPCSGNNLHLGAQHYERRISDDYPKFNAFVYSLETFMPLLKTKKRRKLRFAFGVQFAAREQGATWADCRRP